MRVRNHTKLESISMAQSKVKFYKQKFNQSQKRVRTQSSLDLFVHSLYGRMNREDSLNRTLNHRVSSSKKLLAPINTRPSSKLENNMKITKNIEKNEIKIQFNRALSELQVRTSEAMNYLQANTELFMQKRNLQQTISELKSKIAQEKKKIKKIQMEKTKNQNRFEQCILSENKGQQKHKDIGLKEQELIEQNKKIQSQITSIKNKIQEISIKIGQEDKICEQYQKQIKFIKQRSIFMEKQRTHIKNQYLKKLKSMNSMSNHLRQLHEEKNVLFICIAHNLPYSQ